MSKNNRLALVGSLLCVMLSLINSVGFSQASVNSPYSRFGMGDLATRKATYNFSMGGVANAIYSPQYVNPFNPAANAGIDTLSFIFSGGLISKFGTLSTENGSSPSNFASLGYLLFGFPVTRYIKSSIGLTPYSNVGYKVIASEIVPEVGKTDYYFEGSGGSNEFFLSTSIEPIKNLSVGVKASYLFGKSQRSQVVFFPDSVGYINTRIDNQVDLGDFYFDFGAQFHKPLSNGMTLGFGGIYAPSQKIKSIRNYISRAYFPTAIGVESYRDTIEMQLDTKGSVTIPDKYGVGLMLKNKDKWLVAADFNWQYWSKFEAFGVKDSLTNTFQFSMGGEYLPSDRSIDTYWKKIKYRAGFNFNQTYLNLQNTQINEFGISFGMGLPIPRSFSTLNLGFELGRRGTTTSNLIQENYIKINVGVSIWERWFVKKRYY
ncbi:MAG: hypothetical protein IH598_10025 [Bacteroidales bacterium]|nr:hypothetical protein [Bacteroidales bacterium]